MVETLIDVEKVAAFYALHSTLRKNLEEGMDTNESWAAFLDCLALVNRFDPRLRLR